LHLLVVGDPVIPSLNFLGHLLVIQTADSRYTFFHRKPSAEGKLVLFVLEVMRKNNA